MSKFDDDVYINKYKLDEELVRQPQIYYDWGKAEVIAADEAAKAKDRWEITKAEMEIRIRKQPTLYDLPDNPKEALIKAAVVVNPKVKRAYRRYLRMLKEQRLLAKAEKSMEHRKKSLEGLVSVNMQMHFSTPKGQQRRDFQVEEQRDSLLKTARKKIKRRRRKDYGET